MSRVKLANPLIVALDVNEPAEAVKWAEKLKDHVGAYKIGPRLLMKTGGELVAKVKGFAPVFVDNKYLDIPNTMEASVRATFEAGATFCTVHAWSGLEALQRLKDLEDELNQTRPFQILVVTVLTSFVEKTLPPTMVKDPIDVQVRRLAMLVNESGLSGVVCSPLEVTSLSREWPDHFYVTPGVRLASDDVGDQKRVQTPEQAVKNGASAIVVGRPIMGASDPLKACLKYTEK